jgi:hypothetical protein
MAVTSVHAPVLRRHGGGFGQRQVGSRRDRGDAVAPDRPGTWPERRNSGNGESPQAADHRFGKGTRSRPSTCAWQRTPEPSGEGTGAAGQERKPDAGASAGDETSLWPVARPCERGQTSGAKHAPAEARGKARRNSRQGWSIHTPVRVGSAGMPAPFAFCAAPMPPPSARTAPESNRTNCAPTAPPRAPLRQRFAAFPARLVPQRRPLSDEPLARFAIANLPPLSAAACGREIA